MSFRVSSETLYFLLLMVFFRGYEFELVAVSVFVFYPFSLEPQL